MGYMEESKKVAEKAFVHAKSGQFSFKTGSDEEKIKYCGMKFIVNHTFDRLNIYWIKSKARQKLNIFFLE